MRSTIKRVVQRTCESVVAFRNLNKQDKATVVEYEHAWRTGNVVLATRIREANRDLGRMFRLAELGGLI